MHELVHILQQLRDLLGGPLIVRSGYRCPPHNVAVGGSPSSYHTLGLAADVRHLFAFPRDVAAAARHFKAAGALVGWVRAYPELDICHIDVRPEV